MGRRTEHHYENLARAVEDGDVTKQAKEAMAISDSEERRSAAERRADEDGWFEDEEAGPGVSNEIPPLPQAKPIPGHSKAVTPERMAAVATEPRDAKEAMPAVGNYGDVDPEVMPSGPEARRAWPIAIASGALAAPVTALRLAGHLASKVACKLGILRQRGEEKWQETRAKLKTS